METDGFLHPRHTHNQTIGSFMKNRQNMCFSGLTAKRIATLVLLAALAVGLIPSACAGQVSDTATSKATAKAAKKKNDKCTPLGTALNWIPADAAFYQAALRNREQIETVANSRAWARLCSMPVCREYARLQSHPLTQAAVQIGKARLTEAEPAVSQVETIINDPQVQRFIEFLGDICSDEVFAYGDRGFVDLADLLHETAHTTLSQSLDGQSLDGRTVRKMLVENSGRIVVPNVVLGFKIRDQHLAAEQLGKLELVLGLACWTQPKLNGRMDRKRIDGTSYLTFKLDTRLLPDGKLSLPPDGPLSAGLDEKDAKALTEKLNSLKITIALGIKADYLLVSIGPSTDGLAKLNADGKHDKSGRLIDRSEMQPVREMAGQRLSWIAYRSRELNEVLGGRGRYMAAMAGQIDNRLATSTADKKMNVRLQRDAAALLEDIRVQTPRPGAIVAANVITDRGIETYLYDYTQHPWTAGYKPLELLDHVGGRQLLLKSFRAGFTIAQYDLVIKWLDVGYGYFEDRVLWNIDANCRKRCRLAVALLRPILRQINRINRSVLIPALQDGQVVFVLGDDGPALVTDTTVAERLHEVYEEYWLLYSDVKNALEDVRTGQRPDFTAALAATEPSVSRAPLPDWIGLGGLAVGRVGRVVILATSSSAARQLLQPTPPALGNLPAKSDHPRATVAFIDTAALVDRATPTVNRTAHRLANWSYGGSAPASVEKQVERHVATLFECLKVLRSIARETYVEGGAVVTHTLWEIRDVD